MKNLSLYSAVSAGVVCFALLATASFANTSSAFPYDAPPEGELGDCFARVLIPARYENYTEQTVIDEGGSRISVSAPQFASMQQQYVVRDAGVRYEVRQPVYKLVTEQVMVRPGYQTLQVVPGEYRNVTEQVQVSPPRLSWKPGSSLGSMAGIKLTQTRQGEVYCLVEEPGEVKNITKRVQVRGESVQAINVPAVYKTITREVLVDRGGVREVTIPAQYGSFSVQQLVQPARQMSHATPPRMGSINRKRQVSDERFSWIKVLCETNATPEAISEVQSMLHKQGYYKGPINGSINTTTETAIARYQEQMDIPHGGFLSLQTIESLRGGAVLPPVSQRTQEVSQNWVQNAPAQYSYQSNSSGWGNTVNNSAAWNEVEAMTVNWSNQANASSMITYNHNGITPLPRGEVPTDIIAEQGYVPVTGQGTQQWQNKQYLSWSGK